MLPIFSCTLTAITPSNANNWPSIVSIIPLPEFSVERALRILKSLSLSSSTPIAVGPTLLITLVIPSTIVTWFVIVPTVGIIFPCSFALNSREVVPV